MPLVEIPIADGGEGTVDAVLHAMGGTRQRVQVHGPLGEPLAASYGLLPDGKTAVLEMAQAAGLPLCAGNPQPMQASTFGVGEMLLDALSHGARHILLGLGGSATNDGGMGFLAALGVTFTAADGASVPQGAQGLLPIDAVDFFGLTPALEGVTVTALTDVTNPLLGPQGATAIYGPQKGIASHDLSLVDGVMAHYANKVENALGRTLRAMPGSGAAGGLGFALAAIGAALTSGIDAILDMAGFDAHLRDADLVVTGEGRMDGQSVQYSKGPAGIAKRAWQQHVPTLALVGGLTADAAAFYGAGHASVMVTPNAPMPLDAALADAPTLYLDAAIRMFRTVQIGYTIGRKEID